MTKCFLALSVIADDFILHDAISIKSLCSQCILRFFKMVFLSFSLVLTNNRQWQWKGNVLMTKFASHGLKVPSHCSASLQKKPFSALQASIWSKNRGAPSPPLPWIRHYHWEHFGVWKITNSNSEQFLLPLLHFCKEKKCHARHNTYQEPRSSSFGSWDSVFYCTNPSKSTTSSR